MCLKNDILQPLREKGFSQEWLSKTKTSKVFDEWQALSRKAYIDHCRQWFRDILYDCYHKAKDNLKTNDKDYEPSETEIENEMKNLLIKKLSKKEIKE